MFLQSFHNCVNTKGKKQPLLTPENANVRKIVLNM